MLTSFLEFGSLDTESGHKEAWDYCEGARAYEWFMLARYANDLLAYRDLIATCRDGAEQDLQRIFTEEIHHENDALVNFGKLAALAVIAADRGTAKPTRFIEFGSTLFGCIEGMAFCQALAARYDIDVALDLGNTEWVGVDISARFNELAKLLHPGYTIVTHERMPVNERFDVFFAKGVSLLYQIRSVDELMAFLGTSRLAVFDISFAAAGPVHMTLNTGKEIVYLDWPSVRDALAANAGKLMARRATSQRSDKTGRLMVDGVFGEPALVDAFIATDTAIRGGIAKRCATPELAQLMIGDAPIGEGEWISLDQLDPAMAGR